MRSVCYAAGATNLHIYRYLRVLQCTCTGLVCILIPKIPCKFRGHQHLSRSLLRAFIFIFLYVLYPRRKGSLPANKVIEFFCADWIYFFRPSCSQDFSGPQNVSKKSIPQNKIDVMRTSLRKIVSKSLLHDPHFLNYLCDCI